MTTPVFDPIPSGPPSADLSGELLTALDHIILTLIKLDAESKKAVLLHSRGQKEHSGCPFNWNTFISFYQGLLMSEEVDKLSAALSMAHLKDLRAAGHTYFRVNLACRPETKLDWLEIFVYLDQCSASAAYILVRQSKDNYLLHRIIELYVYNNCDCFFYLDAEKNSCILFNGKPGTPLPPAVCSNYTAAIETYANDHVVPEDREAGDLRYAAGPDPFCAGNPGSARFYLRNVG